MIYDLRTYDLGIGKLPSYLRLFQTTGLEILSRYAVPVGYWFAETGPLNKICHLWAYETQAVRAQRRQALYEDADWLSDFLPFALPHLRRQSSRMLTLRKGSPDQRTHPRAGAEGAWLYEFADIVGDIPAVDAATVARFNAASGDLSHHLEIRAYADDVAFADRKPWTTEARVTSETYHPASFSVLR